MGVTVHGGDFVPIGTETQLKWFQNMFDEVYGCKHEWLGFDEDEGESTRILNRVISWTDAGIEYEADQRHVEVVIEQLHLSDATFASTHGIRLEQSHANAIEIDMLTGSEASRYRMVVVRLNDLVLGRPDLQYAVIGAIEHTAKPQLHHWSLLKRIGRHLLSCTEVQAEV